ncbi:unnamed protein product [Soboliphyme baturini]|uniref:BHLH domain-containing protein n=1 Tax=Soboliphyme baturini TaxID=241478 RepID=A0A183IDI1_9BILA|nr:unnamed protein product [Soboliphyme baturini]
MEKRRRARINKSLNELKSVLMESMKHDVPAHSKWEKADVLEMTVQYMQILRNQQKALRTDPLSVGQFIAGFADCIRQVQQYPQLETSIGSEGYHKLIEHLATYLKYFSDDASRFLQSQIERSPAPSKPLLSSSSVSPITDGSPFVPNFSDSDDVLCLSQTSLYPLPYPLLAPCSMTQPECFSNSSAAEFPRAKCRKVATQENLTLWRPW